MVPPMPSCWSDTRLLFFSVGAALPSSPATLMSLLHNTCRGSHATGWHHHTECTACSQAGLTPCLAGQHLQGQPYTCMTLRWRQRCPRALAPLLALLHRTCRCSRVSCKLSAGTRQLGVLQACCWRADRPEPSLPHPVHTLNDKAHAEGSPLTQHPIESCSQRKHARSLPQPQQVKWCACNTCPFPAAPRRMQCTCTECRRQCA